MAAGTYTQVLGERGFRAFLWTQFLGAFNDNVCRLVISMVALAAAGATGTASGHLPWVTAVFALPFLLFSGYAGQLADTHSKRTVLVVTTVLEVAAMAVGIVAFMNGRLEWMLVVLFLIATQSAFFSPAKYGIVPEIVPERALSRANGLLEMSTFAAIVLGSAAGTALYALWDERLPTIGLALTGRRRRRRRGEHRHPSRVAGARCGAASLEPLVGPDGRRRAPRRASARCG